MIVSASFLKFKPQLPIPSFLLEFFTVLASEELSIHVLWAEVFSMSTEVAIYIIITCLHSVLSSESALIKEFLIQRPLYTPIFTSILTIAIVSIWTIHIEFILESFNSLILWDGWLSSPWRRLFIRWICAWMTYLNWAKARLRFLSEVTSFPYYLVHLDLRN